MATLKASSSIISLTAPQALALATACRDDGAVSLPERLKGGAAQALVAALIGKGLAREVRAKTGMPVCRHDAEAGRSYALVITRLGRASMAAGLPEGSSSDIGASTAVAASPTWANRALTHVRVAVLEPASGQGQPEPSTSMLGSEPPPANVGPRRNSAPRQGSKLAGVIALLSREAGVCIEELTAVTGWLPHTTRAALTSLRKRGYAVLRERTNEKRSVYRIEPMSCAKAA